MKKILLLLSLITVFSCKKEIHQNQFSAEALNDTLVTLNGEQITFQNLLNQYKGETIVIDVWASWCKDCIAGMPLVKALQVSHPQVKYVFLSLDKSIDSWKIGIKNHDVVGENYFLQSGWKGAFGTAIALDWIPRYMVVGKDGSIAVFKAIHANDEKIIEALKNEIKK